MINWYPYFFIDIAKLGWTQALINYVGLLIFFFLVGCMLVALDRTLGGRHLRADPATSA